MAARSWIAALVLLILSPLAPAQEETGDPEPVEAPAAETTTWKREWLAGHQSADGGWSCNGFQSQCMGPLCEGTGQWQSEAGTTGLVLLAFLGYGEAHRSPKYGPVVRRGIDRLVDIQDADGCFGIRYPERFVADHAMATLAMAELASITQEDAFRTITGRGTAFLLSQRGADGGWRAGDRFLESDAVTTSWAVLALLSAAGAGGDVDPEVFRGADAFLAGLTDPETGRARLHRYDDEFSDRATAAATAARLLCGADPSDPVLDRSVDLLVSRGLAPDGSMDPEYWFLGTRACFQRGGDPWKRWNEGMQTAIVKTQVLDPESCRYGSWDPEPGPAAEMGRVATTALGVLCLELYYRYARVFGSDDLRIERRPAPPPPCRPSMRAVNRAAALDPDFPEPRTGFLR
jgi:hypothetical protein